MSAPLYMNVFSTGRIRDYQIAMSLAYIIELILLYVLFKNGGTVVMGVALKAVLNFIVIFIRMIYAHKEVESFSGLNYMKNVFAPLMLSTILTLGIAFLLFQFVYETWMNIGATALVVAVSVLLAYFIGLNNEEKRSLTNTIRTFKKKIGKHD